MLQICNSLANCTILTFSLQHWRPLRRLYKCLINDVLVEISNIISNFIVSFFAFGEFDSMILIDHKLAECSLHIIKCTFFRAIYSLGVFLVAILKRYCRTSSWVATKALRFWLRLMRMTIHCWIILESRVYCSLWTKASTIFWKPPSLIALYWSWTLMIFSKSKKNWRYRLDWNYFNPAKMKFMTVLKNYLFPIVK